MGGGGGVHVPTKNACRTVRVVVDHQPRTPEMPTPSEHAGVSLTRLYFARKGDTSRSSSPLQSLYTKPVRLSGGLQRAGEEEEGGGVRITSCH